MSSLQVSYSEKGQGDCDSGPAYSPSAPPLLPLHQSRLLDPVQLLVKEDENVEIGQTVALLIPGEAPQAASAEAAAPSAAAAAAASSAAQPAPSNGRASLIQFPPRVTSTGERISALSASAQQEALQALSSGPASSSSSPSPASAAPEATAAPAAAAAAGSTTERLSSQPARYPYSDKEMECIMLGGADMVDVRIAVSVQVTVG